MNRILEVLMIIGAIIIIGMISAGFEQLDPIMRGVLIIPIIAMLWGLHKQKNKD